MNDLRDDKATAAPSLGENATVFLLFFGLALIDAIISFSWWTALFWVVIGLLFLLMTRRPTGR